MDLTVHLLVVFVFVFSCVFSCVCSSVSSHVYSSVSCVSSLLESGRVMDTWILGLSALLLAVEVWFVVDWVSSLDVKSVSVSVSLGLELVDFCDSLVGSFGSLDSVGAGESGLDSGMASVFGLSLTSVTAG